MRRPTSALLLAVATLVLPETGRALGLLEPSLVADDNYAETYTFIADLDNGAYVQVQLGITNLGPGSGHGLCRVLWVPPEGKPFTATERLKRKEIAFGRGDEGAWLRIGPCRAVAGGVLSVEAAVGGYTVKLRYATAAKVEQPPAGVIRVDGKEHRTELLVATAKVEARLEKEGRESLVLAGSGYADHSRSLANPKTLARRWVRFRALRGDGPTLVLAREAIDGSFSPIWRRSSGSYRQGGRFALERAGVKERPSFRAAFEGEVGRFDIRSRRQLFRFSPLDEFGAVGRAVAPLVGASITYTFRATLSEEGRPDIPGILEISLAED